VLKIITKFILGLDKMFSVRNFRNPVNLVYQTLRDTVSKFLNEDIILRSLI